MLPPDRLQWVPPARFIARARLASSVISVPRLSRQRSERTRKKKERKKKKELDMTINKMTRRFKYAGLTLPDPAPDLDVESVRSLYAASYPEITTAALTGPEALDGTLVYTFTKAIGTKG
jgi:PRTRC genetic system protein C